MFKWMVIGGLGVVCAIFMVSNTTILKKKERANHVLYETLTTNYIVQRLGVTHVRVMAHITMAPTKNVRVIEALTPQTDPCHRQAVPSPPIWHCRAWPRFKAFQRHRLPQIQCP
jgi:hypothetical protein